MSAAVSLDRVSCTFGTGPQAVRAVDGVDLRIAAGETPASVRNWLIGRYGAWISYRPPVEPLTWPLYAAPLILLGLGGWLARHRLRRRRAS